MAVCVNIRGKRRAICIGDLDRLITLENRAIQSPRDGVDYTELFTDKPIVDSPLSPGDVWSMIETVSGKTVFDSTNIERVYSHKFYIRWIPDVTSETWILFDGERYNILSVEDLDARKEFLLLKATARGISVNSNNAA